MVSKNKKPGCLSVIFPFLKRSRNEEIINKHPVQPDHPRDDLHDEILQNKALPYRLRDDFLSPAEFSFFKIITSLVSPKLSIQSKVRLADIFFVARPNENYAYFNRIAQKHLDFLVCDSMTMKPIIGIELDDSSHRNNNRQVRDEFVESVCEVAGFPLLRIPAKSTYNSREIATQIAPFLNNILPISPISSEPQHEMIKSDTSVPLCPKCDIPMVLRTVAKGEHKGKQFYGCENFPNCRHMKPVPNKIN